MGRLTVNDGTLQFTASGRGELEAGVYDIAYQDLTAIMLGPGTSVSHDVFRLLARHGTGLVVTGLGDVRYYASMPFGPDRSRLARRQATMWASPTLRTAVARRMYAWRLGEVLPATDLAALRGIEGHRVRQMYRHLSDHHGIRWKGRRYDRQDPESADAPNRAINHATTALLAAADIAVAATAAIPQLGFIHEHSGKAFSLDLADLFREEVAIDTAFRVVAELRDEQHLERAVRYEMGRVMRKKKVVPRMIDRIKELFDADDDRGDP